MILADFHLPRRLRATVTAIARVVCASDLDTLGIAEHVTGTVEQCLRAYPAGVRVGLTAGLAAFEAGALLRHRKPFSRLAAPQAKTYFASWWKSPVAPLTAFAHAVKSLCSMAYYDSPAVREKIAYRPDPWIASRVRERLEKYGVAVDEAEAAVVAPDPLLLPLRRHA